MKQHIYPILASQRRRLGLSQQQCAALVGCEAAGKADRQRERKSDGKNDNDLLEAVQGSRLRLHVVLCTYLL